MITKESSVAKPVEVEGFAGNALAYVGAFLIATIGFIHVLQTSELFDVAGYLGFLFIANFIGASAVAIILARTNPKWAWIFGDLISGVAFVAFVVSRLYGLPEYPVAETSWFNLPGVTALMVEGAFLSVSVLALTSQGRKLVNLEEKFVELELSPEPLARDISLIRSRMSADLTDLRAHVSPRSLKKQAAGNARKRLPNLSKQAKPYPLMVLASMTILVLGWRRLKR